MNLTKQTVFLIVETPLSDYDYMAYNQEITDKIAELVSQGKTDGEPEYTKSPDQIEVKRNWVDQAAAEEWTTWLLALEEKYNRAVISHEIIDIPA